MTVGIDKSAPVLTGMPLSNCSVWPPDHRLVQIASISATDSLSGLGGPATISVVSNEPDSGTSAEDVPGDIVISGGSVQIRAERMGSSTGRIYTITVRCTDGSGNSTTRSVAVRVPHDQSQEHHEHDHDHDHHHDNHVKVIHHLWD